jgi:glycerol kinase
MRELVLSIDQGTTGTTVLLLDIKNNTICGSANTEYQQHYPRPGWVEHNLGDIWNSVKSSFNKLHEVFSFKNEEIKAIGITNQRETTCAFDRTGNPLYHAIVWQDRRTQEFCQNNHTQFKQLKHISGLPLDAYFSATKIKWLIDNVPAISNNLSHAFFGTIDTYLLYKLTNGQSYKTDFTNASRTNLMDLASGEWSGELKQFFSLNNINLPEICDSFHNFGETKNCHFLPDGIPILSILGDQQSALFGQGCIDKGQLKCTYGTGAFLLLNTGEQIQYSQHGLLSTAAFSFAGQRKFALEGSSYIAGAAVQWLRDNIKIIQKASDIEALASQASDQSMQDLLFYPFFTGIGSPFWNSSAKACLYGMSRDSGNAQIARACLEGIALSINDLVEAFSADLAQPIHQMKVDGGACKNNFLMQMQASFSNCEVIRPSNVESTALGVAIGATMMLKNSTPALMAQSYIVDKSFSAVNSEYVKNKKQQWSSMLQKIYTT